MSEISRSSSLLLSKSTSLQNMEGFLNLIDGSGNFSHTASDLSEFMKRGQKEDEYAVVAIMGVQSSGKSTLLNRLFGTRFREMDSTTGRSQTTLGIWLDSAKDAPHITVMDLEGTDSGERGEDRTTFERQTTLYALALAEVLIINLWEHDIGRYTASNYGILKTVFEVNLQLFDNPSKTLVLFVVRDHIEHDTPAELLKKKLLTEVTNIWNEIEKPPHCEDHPISKYFDFEFAALPHMKLQKKEFDEEVKSLQRRFCDENDENYLFSHAYHGLKTVPADGFGVYAENIWNTIKNAEALNLPGQKEMLSTFRCDELGRAAVESFLARFQELEVTCNQGFTETFGETANDIINETLSSFVEAAKKYLPTVVQLKQSELFDLLSERVHSLFQTQMNFAVHDCLATMKEKCDIVFDSTHACENFNASFEVIKTECVHMLEQKFSNLLIENVDWTIDTYLPSLDDGTSEIYASRRSIETMKMNDDVNILIKKRLIPEVSTVLVDVKTDFRPDLKKIIAKFIHKLKQNIGGKLEGFGYDQGEVDGLLMKYQDMATAEVLADITRHADLVATKMRDRFDARFRYDSSHLPRKWSRVKPVKARKLFVEGKEYAMEMLQWYEEVPISVEQGEETTCVLTPERKDEVVREFNSKVEASLKEAEAEYDKYHAQAKVPGWMFVLLAVFGFNEIMMLLRNPLLIVFFIGVGVWLYYTFVLDQGGPSKTILKGVLDTGVNIIDTQWPDEGSAPAMITSLRSSMASLSEIVVPPKDEEGETNNTSSSEASEKKKSPNTETKTTKAVASEAVTKENDGAKKAEEQDGENTAEQNNASPSKTISSKTPTTVRRRRKD